MTLYAEVLADYSARSDDRPLTDAHPWQDDHACSDPQDVFNYYLLRLRVPLLADRTSSASQRWLRVWMMTSLPIITLFPMHSGP